MKHAFAPGGAQLFQVTHRGSSIGQKGKCIVMELSRWLKSDMKFAAITFKPLLHLAFAWSRPVATEHVLWPRNIFSAATTCLIAITWLANVQPRAKQDKSQIRTQRMISKINRHAVLRFDHMPKWQTLFTHFLEAFKSICGVLMTTSLRS